MDPELSELMCVWVGTAVPEHRRDALLQRLRTDAAFRQAFVSEVRVLGMLKVVRASPPRWLRLEELLGWSADEPDDVPRALADAVAARIRDLPIPGPLPAPARRRRWALAVLLLIGALAAVIPHEPRREPPPSREVVAVALNLTGAEWAGNGLSEGGGIGSGPLVLRKGRVTLAFRTGVTALVEGPADIDVVSAGQVFCHRGRLRVEVPAGVAGFTVAAPGASVAGVGVAYELTVGDDRSEVLVHAGQPVVSTPSHARRAVAIGEFVRIDPRTGRMSAVPPKALDTRPPSNLPLLAPAPGYAKAVLDDRPAGYWRFESVADGVCPNEIADGPGFRLIGLPSLHGAPGGGNRSLYLPASGLGGPHGALSEGAWKPTDKEFALECWVLPRMAALTSVLGALADLPPARFDAHVAYIELTGSVGAADTRRRVRGLYRLPTSVECFSERTYQPLEWLHVVAQHRNNQFELYVNGVLTAKQPLEVKRVLPASRLLIGALYASRDGKSCTGRPFAGLIDEVAVYDHALAPADVLRHYRLGASQE